MKTRAFYLSFVAAMVFVGAVQAGPVADGGLKAEQLLEKGDTIGALNALDEAAEAIWEKSPLVFRKVLFVEDADGFGVYRPRASSVFKVGEPLIVYVEPVGFGYGKHPLGGNEINLVSDFVLAGENGGALLSRDDFLNVTLASLYRNREFQMKLTVNLTGLPPGKYVAKFHVRDANSSKSGDFELPFEMVE